MQYTQYEKGQYYDWHYDETIESSVYVGSNATRGKERIDRELELMYLLYHILLLLDKHLFLHKEDN